MLMREISKVLSIIFLIACCVLLINSFSDADDKKPQQAKVPEWELFEKGNSLFMSGKYQDAIGVYTKAIELNPKVALFYNNRGYAYRHLENFKKAIEDYNKAIALDPAYAGAYNNRGIAYGKLGNHAQEIADYNKATGSG